MSRYVDVSGWDDAYSETKTDEFDYVPDGNYEAMITKAEFRLIGKVQKPAFEWNFEIINNGPLRGARVQKVSLNREDLMKWLKIDMRKIGMQAQTLTEIQRQQRELLGIAVEIKVKSSTDDKGIDRTNIYICKKLREPGDDDEPLPPSDDDPPPPSDDDAPW